MLCMIDLWDDAWNLANLAALQDYRPRKCFLLLEAPSISLRALLAGVRKQLTFALLSLGKAI